MSAADALSRAVRGYGHRPGDALSAERLMREAVEEIARLRAVIEDRDEEIRSLRTRLMVAVTGGGT